MSYSSIGAAIAGAGFIGPVHLEALRRLGVKVTGILGCDVAESQAAKEATGVPKAYTNYDELLADSEVQSVHLAVPNVFHFPMAKEALEAGKHVLCEKPLAMNSAEASELVELANSQKLAAGVCYNVRFYPVNLEAAQMVRSGAIGDVLLINGSYVQDWLLYDTDYNWRVLAEQGGELRAVADIGTHWMDLAQTITGLEIQSVFADLQTVYQVRQRPKGEVETFTGKLGADIETEAIKINTEDYGALLLRFSNGARGSVNVSQVTAGRKNCIRYEISGSKSSLSWNSETPNDLWIGHRSRSNEILTRDPSLVSDLARRFINYPGGHNEGFPDTFKQCFRAFYDTVLSGDFSSKPLYPTFESGRREVQLCEAVLKSYREQRWIEI